MHPVVCQLIQIRPDVKEAEKIGTLNYLRFTLEFWKVYGSLIFGRRNVNECERS